MPRRRDWLDRLADLYEFIGGLVVAFFAIVVGIGMAPWIISVLWGLWFHHPLPSDERVP